MKVKRILLTGDDGYNSTGTRLLVHILKSEYQLCIAGTKDQQSGVGGRKTLGKNLVWGEDVVDGVQAIWIEGTPVDSIECAKEFFKEPFDLVISGINFGVNVSGSLITSGTFSAAFHAVNLGIAPWALSISLDCSANKYIEEHKKDADIRMYHTYPGQEAYKIIQEAIKEDLWGAEILNINFPAQPTAEVIFTDCMETMYGLWATSVLYADAHTYTAPVRTFTKGMAPFGTDVWALEKGKISITPCHSSMVDKDALKKIKKPACFHL